MDPLSALGALTTCVSVAFAISQKRAALQAIAPDSQGLCERVGLLHQSLDQLQRSGRAADAAFERQLRELEATLGETNAFAVKMLSEPPNMFRVAKRAVSSVLGKYTKRIDELSKRLDRHMDDMHFASAVQIEGWRSERRMRLP